MHGTRRAFKTPRKRATNPLHIRFGSDQATVSVLKLMMIIQVYICAFLNAAPADQADDRLLSASILHPSRNPRIPSLHVDVLPDTGAWSADSQRAIVGIICLIP